VQINSLLPGYSDPSHAGHGMEPMESPVGKPEETSPLLSLRASGPMAALREVARRYDVTDITPRAFSKMLQELHANGALDDQQFRELSLIRMDLDLANLEPDESLDLLHYYSGFVAKLRHRQGEDSALAGKATSPAGAERRLAWLEKMATLQSAPEAIGLDALV